MHHNPHPHVSFDPVVLLLYRSFNQVDNASLADIYTMLSFLRSI
jgi:hypothetical protein